MATSLVYMSPASLYAVTYDWTYSGGYADVDDPWDAPDDGASILMAYAQGSGAGDRSGKFYFGLGAGPVGVILSKVTLRARAWLQGAGSYWSAGSVSLQGYLWPGGAGTEHAGTSIDLDGAEYWNSNLGGSPTVVQYDLGSWTTNPTTSAPWELSDLTTLKVGYYAFVPYSYGSPGSGFGLAVTQILAELEVVGASANVEVWRSLATAYLRTQYRGQRKTTIVVPPAYGDIRPLQWCEISHRSGPSELSAPETVGSGAVGWSERVGERRDHLLVGRIVDPMARTVELSLWDVRDAMSSFWLQALQDIGYTDDGQGVAILAPAGALTCVRAQTIYVPRPNDGLFMACGADKPAWAAPGLLVEGATKSLVLNDTFSQGSGDAFTDWAISAPDPGASITQDVGDFAVDVAGFRRSAKISSGSAPSAKTILYQYVGMSAGTLFRPVVMYRNDSPAGALQVLLYRSDGASRNIPAGSWSAGAWYSLPQTSGAVGLWIGEPVDLGAASGCSLYLSTGTVANTSSHVLFATFLVVPGAETTAIPITPRTLLVTTTAAVDRVADVISVPSNADSRRWRPERGSAAIVGTPNWSHSDLADGEERCVVSATLGSSDRDQILYRRTSSTAGKWIFSRRTGGSGNDVEVAVSGTDLPARLVRVRLGARWTSADGELGTARLAQLFVYQTGGSGLLSASLQLAAVSSLDASETLYLGGNGGTGRTDVWDGAIELVDVVPRVLYDEELKRRMGL